MGKEKKKKKSDKKQHLTGAFIVSTSREDIALLLEIADRLNMGFHELSDEECRYLVEPEKKKSSKSVPDKEGPSTKKAIEKPATGKTKSLPVKKKAIVRRK